MDYLKEICSASNILLEYSNNKFLVLSSSFQHNTYKIRADKGFKNCPLEVAKAIFNYFTTPQDDASKIQIIKEYIESLQRNCNFKFEPPCDEFIRLYSNKPNPSNPIVPNAEKEMEILRIIHTNSSKDKKRKSLCSDTIKLKENAVFEMDIIVRE